MKKNIFYYLSFFIIIFIIDRISKYYILSFLSNSSLKISRYLSLSLIWNRGVSWGFLHTKSQFGFCVVTALVISIIILFSFFTYQELKENKCIWFHTLVLTGALSNLIDRFIYGGVVDFIDLHYASLYWPTFNIADIYVVIGVIGIVLQMIRTDYDDKN
jgi:signal peptidase II